MSVRAQRQGLRDAARQVPRLLVVAGEDVAAVEALDGVYLALDPLQRVALDDGAPEDVVGMRDDDEAALFMDAADGLLRRHASRHQLLEEEADNLALGRLHLLADDDLEAAAGLLRQLLDDEGALDLVVVRDGDAVDALAQAALDERARADDGVAGVVRMAVEVGAQLRHRADTQTGKLAKSGCRGVAPDGGRGGGPPIPSGNPGGADKARRPAEGPWMRRQPGGGWASSPPPGLGAH